MSDSSVLALGAHPDDLEFGLGGVLCQAAQAGVSLHLAVFTRGEAASHGTPEIRRQEAEAAAALLPARLHWVESSGDGALGTDPNLALKVARLIRLHRPQKLFAPTPDSNQHPDHAALGQAARQGARLARYGGLQDLSELSPLAIEALYFYAVTPHPTPLPALLVDISSVMEEWRRLMSCHLSQLASKNYLDLQISRARTLGLTAGVEYAQAVYANDPPVLATFTALPRAARSF